MQKLTVLYNDKCPVCSFEIEHYRGLSLKRDLPLEFEKISEEGHVLQATGLSSDTAKKRLHVRLPSGEVRIGVDAFLALWQEMPGYRHLARIVALPGLYWFSVCVYDRILAPMLYAWDQRRSRLDGDKQPSD
jgi:predicted DCC family thiol-disulfide oxidoreductase YuxK